MSKRSVIERVCLIVGKTDTFVKCIGYFLNRFKEDDVDESMVRCVVQDTEQLVRALTCADHCSKMLFVFKSVVTLVAGRTPFITDCKFHPFFIHKLTLGSGRW